jgi:hypothetical protein
MVPLVAFMAIAVEPPAAKPGDLKPPSVRFTGATEQEGYIFASFEVTNPNDASLPYVGYTSDSFEGGLKDGAIAPIYRIELKNEDRWNKHDVGFCGTGIGPVTLPPKSKVTFQAVLPAGEWDAAKVGLSWWYPTADESKATVAWSSEISRQEVEKKGPEAK